MVREGLDRIKNDPQLWDHWMKRGLAYIIDSVIIIMFVFVLVIIATMILFVSFFTASMSDDPSGALVAGFIVFIIFVIIAFSISILYWVILDAKGGTLGKRIMKLKPVALEGEMTYFMAFKRNLSKILGGIVGGMIAGILIGTVIEFIIVFLDGLVGASKGEDPRRKYTDFMAGTTVVRTDITETFAPGIQTPMPTPTKPVSVATTPVPTTQTPATAAPAQSQSNPRALLDSFLLGDITEEEYIKERNKLTKAV